MNIELSKLIQKFTNTSYSKHNNFHRITLMQKFEADISNRSFFDNYQIFYRLAIVLALFAQIASMISSYHYIQQLVAIKIKQNELNLLLTTLLLLLIEVVKFYLFKITLRKLFAQKPETNFILIAQALLISLFSAYASVTGGGHLGTDTIKIQTLSKDYEQKIKEVQTQILELQSSDAHKEILWLGNGNTTKILSEQGKALIQKREGELDLLRQKQQNDLAKQNTLNQHNQQQYQIFFGIFEMLFVLCTCFVWYFKRTSVLDEALQQVSNNEVEKSMDLEAFFTKFSESLFQFQNKCIASAKSYPEIDAPHKPKTNKLKPIGFEIKRVANTNASKPIWKPKSILNIQGIALQSKVNENLNSIKALENDDLTPSDDLTQSNEIDKNEPNITKPNKPIAYTLKSMSMSEPNKAAIKIEEENNAKLAVSAQSKAKFEKLLQNIDLKNAKYLQKYREVVEFIFEMQSQNFQDSEIKTQTTALFGMGETTYYNIKRILNNPTN